jgi:hypothetical protein
LAVLALEDGRVGVATVAVAARLVINGLAFWLEWAGIDPVGHTRLYVDQRVGHTAWPQHLCNRLADLRHGIREVRLADAEGVLDG